jgi:hypothetical protein
MTAVIVAPALHLFPAPKGPALISPGAVTTAAPSLSNPDRQTVSGRPQPARAVPARRPLTRAGLAGYRVSGDTALAAGI